MDPALLMGVPDSTLSHRRTQAAGIGPRGTARDLPSLYSQHETSSVLRGRPQRLECYLRGSENDSRALRQPGSVRENQRISMRTSLDFL